MITTFMKNIDIDRLAGRLYPGVEPEILDDKLCCEPLSSELLTDAEAQQMVKLRGEAWAAKGYVEACLVWDETDLDIDLSVPRSKPMLTGKISNMRRVAVVTHTHDGKQISVIHALDGAS